MKRKEDRICFKKKPAVLRVLKEQRLGGCHRTGLAPPWGTRPQLLSRVVTELGRG